MHLTSGAKDNVDFTAYGGSVLFYPNEIALPRLGLTFGNNKKYLGNFFTNSIGFAS
ncbi:MAG: hypothetical protein H7318_06270 [Oligoflexus sp.]|nr:hypothetical protein [Oligoflexus sp.]